MPTVTVRYAGFQVTLTGVACIFLASLLAGGWRFYLKVDKITQDMASLAEFAETAKEQIATNTTERRANTKAIEALDKRVGRAEDYIYARPGGHQ